MRIVVKLCFVLVLISFSVNSGIGQSNIGLPIIKNYTKEIYDAGLQNWEIHQDEVGKMYFANNDGLLVFDGVNWQKIQVSNKTIVRSLLIDGKRIYIGSQGDFGYFIPNKNGELEYHSLLGLFPAQNQVFADVWDMVKNDSNIYIRTTFAIYLFDGKKITTLSKDKIFQYLGKVNDKTYLIDDERGMSVIKGSRIIPLNGAANSLKDKFVSSILPFSEEQILITTYKHGLFLYDGEKLTSWQIAENKRIISNRINGGVSIDDNRIALGTTTGGVFIIDKKGQVLEHFNIKNGLQSNDILNVFKDAAGNLWLGLSNGIDYIETNSSFSIIEPDGELRGTGYAVKIFDGNIYFGTANGLYQATWKNYYNPFENSRYKLVSNTFGQVWGLDVHKNELLVGHHEGTFRVSGNQAVQISNLPGTWKSIMLKESEDMLIEGNYSGLNLYEYENGQWAFKTKIENMVEESCRILAEDNYGNIWVAHPYRGVYRVVLSEDRKRVKEIKLYNSKSGFPSDLYINVFKIGEGVVFSGERGIYEYNSRKDRFELSPTWSEIIDSTSRVQRLIEDKQGNIWFVIDGEVGVFWIKDLGVEKNLQKQIFPELTNKLVGGFEHIYPYDDNNVFFPLERGFMHFNPSKYRSYDSLFHVHLQSVRQGDTSLVFGGWSSNFLEKPKFKYFQNSFTFMYSATDYSNFNNSRFQYYLEGLDDDWSAWNDKPSKEYTNLPPGDYIFKVKARNRQGQVSEIKSYEFEILPPWYASRTAITIYGLLFIGLLGGLIFIPRRQFEQEKAILKLEQKKTLQQQEDQHQKVVEENQAAIHQLEQEKYQKEIHFKNQELATATMHLVQKGEFLNKLQEALTRIEKNAKDPHTKKEIRKTIKLFNQQIRIDEDWEQFSKHFDQVHEDFLKRLRESYPQLTPKDLRLCSYLKMNLSTKEIAPLLNISVRGVEISRYRLRKKMELESSVNLNEFMINF